MSSNFTAANAKVLFESSDDLAQELAADNDVCKVLLKNPGFLEILSRSPEMFETLLQKGGSQLLDLRLERLLEGNIAETQHDARLNQWATSPEAADAFRSDHSLAQALVSNKSFRDALLLNELAFKALLKQAETEWFKENSRLQGQIAQFRHEQIRTNGEGIIVDTDYYQRMEYEIAQSEKKLLVAMREGDYRKVEELLQHPRIRDFVNAQNDQGLTALHMAVSSDNEKIVKDLIAKGAEINIADRGGMTPLHITVQKNNQSITGFLLGNGAKINAPTSGGWTPLHFAAFYGHKDMITLLLNHNAQKNVALRTGETPLDLARQRNHHDVMQRLQPPSWIRRATNRLTGHQR